MIGLSTIGNATIIAYDEKPILSTDPWIGDEDPAYFGSWVLSHEIPKDYKKDIYNLMGKETKNVWELFEIIAKKHNKKIFKIKTKIINKILPKFIKENFFKKNSFLGQFLSIDQSFINEKDITII